MFKSLKNEISNFISSNNNDNNEISNSCSSNNVEGFFAPRGLFAIMDLVSKELSTPFYAKTDEQALRLYESEIAKALQVTKEQSLKLGYEVPFSSDDYKLYKLGTIDIETGCIVPMLQDLERF